MSGPSLPVQQTGLTLNELLNRSKLRSITSLRLTHFVARLRSTAPHRTLFSRPQQAAGYVTQRTRSNDPLPPASRPGAKGNASRGPGVKAGALAESEAGLDVGVSMAAFTAAARWRQLRISLWFLEGG